jgi:trimethylamine--corrinoid protein Co-methyltransferase
MKSNTTAYRSLYTQVLSKRQCEEIFSSALEVLEQTGVTFHDEEAQEILKKAGCYVDGIRVRIPSQLVERALLSVPHRVTLCDSRSGERTMFLEGYNAYYGTGSDTPFYIDPYTLERKKATKLSVAQACKLIDYLPNIDFVMSLGIVRDVPQLIYDRHQFEAQILNTSKPIVTTATDVHGFADIIEMCEIIAGGEESLRRNPFMTLYAEPISPLQHAWEAATKLILAAKKQLPVVYTPCVMGGGTVPSTMAGVMTNGLAESLSGLVLHQQTREGAPFIMGGVFTIMDMSSTIFSYGSPEFRLLMTALADMAHFLRLPMFGTCGCSDSKMVDEQTGIECASSILMTQLGASHLNHDVGYIEYGSTASFENLVMCDDIIGVVRKMAKGIYVDKETLAVDVIDEVGPGGDFSTHAHTKLWSKKAFSADALMDRQSYESWSKSGSKTLFQRANEKVKDILEHYEPVPLPKDVQGKIKAIVERAEGRLKAGYQK